MSKIRIATNKPKMSNSDFIQLSCELADSRVLEVYVNSYKKDGSYKTESIQDCFNESYDFYQSILEKYIEEEKEHVSK